MTRPLIVIPARYGSTRLPGKMLLADTGKPLIQHTWERCSQVPDTDVLIATDHDAIIEAAQGFGAEAIRTDANHQSGTARVAEAARERAASMVINCQGDEPEIDPGHISQLIKIHEAAEEDKHAAEMSTLACAWPDDIDPLDPNTVKVVTTVGARETHRYALYFSRSLIPFPRTEGMKPLMHLGLYAFSPQSLQAFADMPPSGLEATESLEQLRALEAGWRIAVGIVSGAKPGIDTAEDYQAFVKRTKG